jgi:hypothetical protein
MNFSEALTLLKAGHKICRAQWEYTNMNKCLELDKYSPFRKPNINVYYASEAYSSHSIEKHALLTEDILKEDWEIFKGPYRTTTRLEDGLHRFEIKTEVDDYTTWKQEHEWKQEHPNFVVVWMKGDPVDGKGKEPIALIPELDIHQPFDLREGRKSSRK